ncbi:uncharacterized protein CANTADRAFT_31860, partial [Suhomyces tanzawaensis NRRL Y-17324]
IDHQGLQAPDDSDGQSEIVYEIKDQASFHITRALFIANLRRPVNAINFQNYLKELAADAGGLHVERAWLNRSRTHGIVLVDREEGAEFIRDKLNGSVYPSPEEDEKLKAEYEAREQERFELESVQYQKALDDAEDDRDKDELKEPVSPREFLPERLPLYVDYIPVKAINQWVFEEDRGPRNGVWKIDYESRGEEVIANHTLLNGDFIPRYDGSGPRPYDVTGPRPYDGTGPRPYNVVPSKDGYQPRDYVDSYRGDYKHDSYVPGQRSRERPRTDTYEPLYRDRSPQRSRSP